MGPLALRDYLNKYPVSSDGTVRMSDTALYRHFNKMREEILRHKWIESEKVHHDVGFEYALVDWIVKYKAGWDKKSKN